MNQLLRRAWDALDSFKQAYPENWHEDDEQVMIDLMGADLQLSGVKPKWVGLTDEETKTIEETTTCAGNESWLRNLTKNIEAKLRSKNDSH